MSEKRIVKGRYKLTQLKEKSKRPEIITKEANKYIAQLTNEPINKLTSLGNRDFEADAISNEKRAYIGKTKVTLTQGLKNISANDHKTLKKVTSIFTAKNNIENYKSGNVNYRVTVDIEEMAIERKELPPEILKNKKKKSQKMKNFRKKLKGSLDNLTENIRLDDGDKKYLNTSFFATAYIKNKGKTLYVTLNPDFADNLLSENKITQYPKVLYTIDARDKNTYALGNVLNDHFSKYTNQKGNKKTGKKPTYDRLKVKTCLKNLPNIMTYEEVLYKDRSWKEQMKEPFENSLDSLISCNYLIEWHYGHKNGQFLTDDEMVEYTTDYSKWSELNIYFTPHNYWELIKYKSIIENKEKELKKLDKLYK